MCNDWKDLQGLLLRNASQIFVIWSMKKFYTMMIVRFSASHSAVVVPRDDQVDQSMEKIFQIKEDSDDCQFSFEKFVKALTDEIITWSGVMTVSTFLYSLLCTLNKIYKHASSLPVIISVCMGFMKKLVRVIFVENFLFFNFYKKYFT